MIAVHCNGSAARFEFAGRRNALEGLQDGLRNNGRVNDVIARPPDSSLLAGKRARGLAHGWADCRNGIV